jgi:hypothetical protein
VCMVSSSLLLFVYAKRIGIILLDRSIDFTDPNMAKKKPCNHAQNYDTPLIDVLYVLFKLFSSDRYPCYPFPTYSLIA